MQLVLGLPMSFMTVGASLGLPDNHTDDQVYAKIESGTFAEPGVNFRPRFRYWLPDASANLTRVAQDIADAGAVGAAGVEVLGFYLYGASVGTFVPVDWATYGWGTPAWKELFDTAIQAHIDNGLIMDFAMGPNQGQGVPADPEDEGLMWDLNPYSVFVPLSGSFNGTVPGWGTGELQAVVTGLITESANLSTAAPSLPNDSVESRLQHTLSTESLQDVTQNVTQDGQLQIVFPDGQDGLENVVFAVYLVRSGVQNQLPPQDLLGPQTAPQSFVQNGSWIVDHFSAAGANVMTNFWENYILVDGTKELLMQVAEYGWEDSIEINPNIYWTPGLPQAFEERRGYSINKWYPVLFHQNSILEHFTTWFVTDEPDSGNSHIADYRTTLTEGYGEYISTLNTWANEYLDIQYSCQVGYNMAVDIQSTIPLVNAPECEDLAFGSNIDGYRQFTGAANMAGKRVISAEVGAELGQVFQQAIPNALQLYKRLYAGGINAIVMHGYPYSGQYPNTTWPGFVTFTYAWSEMHGRHQPGWDFMLSMMKYCARHSYLLQSGVPRMDVAFYQKLTTYDTVATNYLPTDLTDIGYSYQYLNPENLALPEAYVEDGVLGPNMQAFKALVVRGNDTLTALGAQRIAEIAKDGLPVIFSGGFPSYLASYNSSGAAYVNETLQALSGLSNVHQVPYEALASVLGDMGIEPLTRVQANSTWRTLWRHNADTNEDYVYVYHDPNYLGTEFSTGSIEFQSTGVPYFFNAWTGEQTTVGTYTQTDISTTIYLTLARDQTVIIGFMNNETPSVHATSTSGAVISVVQTDGSLVAQVGYSDGGSSSVVTTSDGQTHSVQPTSAEPFELLNWNLTVEAWNPPSDLSEIDLVAVKSNTTYQLDQPTSWQNIDGLQHTSGRGYYSVNFDWPPTDDSSGALISFGPVVHTLNVTVNGQSVPPLDVTDATADITAYLVQGQNTLEAVVSTPLGNGMAPIWDSLVTSGSPPEGLFGSNTQPSGDADYGLLYPVIVTPYHSVKVSSTPYGLTQHP
ncbi:secreted protein [Xylariales sp. PMI_506]|nr:secreted protein [Xylariales sp. PMI_506]